MKNILKTARRNSLMVLLVVLVLSGCASQPKNQIMLMPAPDVFDRGEWDPFTDRDPIKDIPYGGILYATDTPDADTGNGHAYFRQSPSTSSDILATLIFDLKAEERGLEQTGGRPIWTFSADYIDKLREALVEARPN